MTSAISQSSDRSTTQSLDCSRVLLLSRLLVRSIGHLSDRSRTNLLAVDNPVACKRIRCGPYSRWFALQEETTGADSIGVIRKRICTCVFQLQKITAGHKIIVGQICSSHVIELGRSLDPMHGTSEDPGHSWGSGKIRVILKQRKDASKQSF